MSICESFMQVFDTNSKTYAFVSLTANTGTIVALFFTIISIRKSEKQNKKDSAQKSLDVAFKNIYESLDAVTFLMQYTGGPDFYTGRDAIYRVHALSNLHGLSSNKTNYKIINGYLGLLRKSLSVIFSLSKEIENEDLRSFYLEKVDVEEVFLKNILYELVQKLLSYETDAIHKKVLQKIELDINDILASLK